MRPARRAAISLCRDPAYIGRMTATADAAPIEAPAKIVRRYYLAMAIPFAIDALTLFVYAGSNRAVGVVLPSMAIAAAFLVVGVSIGAWFLIRPVARFIHGEVPFAAIESDIARLPRSSAILVGALYLPMMALRVLSHRVDITFGAMLEPVALPDAITSVVVGTLFNIVLTYFVVNAYLDRLCEHLFRAHGVNLSTFDGRFRNKVALALIFLSFAGMSLLAADIASYSGERLIREATVDLALTLTGAAFVYYWIAHALTRPIDRIDSGMRRVAEDDYTVRLPVTSNDELGHAASRFNQMVEDLAEREYLRDTFGKYVSESVAASILGNSGRSGRAIDTTADATLMFTDIEGFTGLSERAMPTEVAAGLNAYLRIVVPVILRHGGVVNNFIGDGLFASFNLPLPLENHAAAAIAAALEIQQALASATLAGASVRTRIGINTGPVIGVTIGTENRLSYTLLGDAVNVASRLEQLNKRFGSRILAAESTVLAAGAAGACERLGESDVRGHQGNVVVYRVGPA
jgi:class 3 adenylate cyclase